MLEVVIERWRGLDGQVAFRWSIWADGRRSHMGGPQGDSEAAEAAARTYCQDRLGRVPDRVTRL